VTKALLVVRDAAEAVLARETLASADPGAFALTCVPSIAAALEHLRVEPPDVVLLELRGDDPRLPDVFEPLERLRTAAPEIPVVVAVDREAEALGAAALHRGARDFVVKRPQRSTLLARVLHHALETERLERSLVATRGREAVLAEDSRRILETAHDAFIRMDEEGRIVGWNRRAETMFGWRRDEVLGRPMVDILIPPAHREAHREGFRRYLESGGALIGRRIRVPALHREGHESVVEISLWVSEEGGPSYNALVTDVTEQSRAEESMRRSEERFRAVFEGATFGIAMLDLQDRIVAANAALQRLLGFGADQLLGVARWKLADPEEGQDDAPERTALLAGRRNSLEAERRFRTRDGRPVWLRIKSSLVRDGAGNPDFVVEMFEDVTHRRHSEEELRGLTVQLLGLIAAAANQAATVDEALRICVMHVCEKLDWPVGHALLTAEDGALIPTLAWHMKDPERYARFQTETMADRFVPSRGFPGRMLVTGRPMWIADVASQTDTPRADAAREAGLRAGFSFPIVFGTDVVGGLEFFTSDAAELDPRFEDALASIGAQLGQVIFRKRMEAEMVYHALHDPLTSLPNRMLFMDRLTHAMARLDRTTKPLALLFIDVDDFKEVNDLLGHAAGDQLLVTLAQRVRSVLRPGDTVARHAGDEFTVLCEGVSGEAEAVMIAERIAEAVRAPFVLKDVERHVGVSIGIALTGDDEAVPDALIRDADVAMYRAKQEGGGRHVMFDEPLRVQVRGRRHRERALKRAIDLGQLRLLYQPGVSLRGEAIEGIEALVRWQHPERGLLTPEEIIPIAEETGLIVPLGQWVLEQACAQAARWREALPSHRRIPLWVNLSSRQLLDGSLPRHVEQVLARTGLEPASLCLEITESVLLDDTDAAIRELQALRALGVCLAIDDFGTGYSALGYLRRFPIVNLKLDRSFVGDLGLDPQATAIARGVVSLAHSLGLTVVAEGVETATQLEQLRSVDCDWGQGFFFARPQTADDLQQMLAKS
jgi:diguanylate cyclase (GGDEF)-like protein/PAS domain S-box-containing protein